MLGKTSVKVGQVVRFLHFLHFVPFNVDKKSGLFSVDKIRWRHGLWVFLSLHFLLHSLHTCLSYIYRLSHNSFASRKDFGMHTGRVCASVILVPMVLNTLIRPHELASYFNGLFKLDSDLTRNWKYGNQTNRPNGANKFLSLVRPWMIMNSLSLFSAFLKDTSNPRFPCYLTESFGIGAKVLCGVFELTMSIQFASILGFYCIIFFVVPTSITDYWLRVISGAKEERLAWRPQRALNSYRALFVLNAMYNSCLSALVWPTFVLGAVLCHTLCVYITIKLADEFHLALTMGYPVWALAWLGIEFTLFPFVAKTMERSNEFKLAWKGRRVNKIQRKVLGSMRPIGVKVGIYGNVGKTTGLMVMGMVIELTINMLLMF